MTTLEIVLICVISYIVLWLVETTIISIYKHENTMFIDEIWLSLLFWWLDLILQIIDKYRNEVNHETDN